MPHYRITVRYGAPRPRYHVMDLESPGIAEALGQAGARLPEEVAESADLVELRVHAEPERPEEAS